jgi:hypothetical protein
VVAVAAGTEVALAHPDEALDVATRIALGGGVAVFVCGTAVALWRATGRRWSWRWVLAPAAAIAVFIAGATPWVAMLIILVALVAIGAIEHRTGVGGIGHRA